MFYLTALFICLLRRSHAAAAAMTSPPPHRASRPQVLFVMGATGTGKSKLAVDLATRLSGEVVNSDKIQLHDGLPILTNKVTPEEAAGVAHHLISILGPDTTCAPADFRCMASSTVAAIAARGRLPIVAGGSNSFLEELVNGGGGEFRKAYDCRFLWLDVAAPELYRSTAARVDRMVQAGLVDEVRRAFRPEDGDYSKGIRRAIGVQELDGYLRLGAEADDAVLEAAIHAIKTNTWKLVRDQLRKIHQLRTLTGWEIQRLDATVAFRKRGEGAREEWEEVVLRPALKIVRGFMSSCHGDAERDSLFSLRWVPSTRVASHVRTEAGKLTGRSNRDRLLSNLVENHTSRTEEVYAVQPVPPGRVLHACMRGKLQIVCQRIARSLNRIRQVLRC